MDFSANNRGALTLFCEIFVESCAWNGAVDPVLSKKALPEYIGIRLNCQTRSLNFEFCHSGDLLKVIVL